ncbi:protoporphyrinogen oxidase HemJ [Oceanomicrobium pacificus]|uniref:Protoporphyrinogen IX oxidase n=1 Tax=Oceanomicrobium pacificus TaxID=2692916 RepID=A0A6B0TSD1_9RHOB|nr:protoporphyrinogen oxidase HemJ [Oceanomicrobium pacificus]MXU64715.1 protoporphyrinogen oxidase HemJ [Oceanomicrobium pacificus]
MGDFLSTLYPWTKALHVIAVISWMAGLLYLPRLFVYHAENAPAGSEKSELFKVMERKLLRLIMNPAMIVTWVAGLMLAFTPGIVDWSSDIWFHVKFAAILGMTWFHHWLGYRRKEFESDTNTRPGRRYRVMNEVPTLLMIVIVIMVIVRPF